MLNKKALAASVSAAPAEYVEDVFSTYLYTGNSSTQTITNGIDLAGEGGLTWIKRRDGTSNNVLFDTERGATNFIYSNTTAAQASFSDSLTSFNSNGFSLGEDQNFLAVNYTNYTYASWTFRKAPKFFDVVTFTGNGAGSQTVAHNLGSVPGIIILKPTSASGNWSVYHRSLGANNRLLLQATDASTSSDVWDFTTPTSTNFYFNGGVNGTTYVAYLFAHDAGGFGTAGTDNVISCGSFTTDGSAKATVTLGYEVQFVLVKRTDSSTAGGWWLMDTMRGYNLSENNTLQANTSSAENASGGYGNPTATGFLAQFEANASYIYMAIRRPMKVPTTGTEVFSPTVYTGTNADNRLVNTSLLTDMVMIKERNDTVAGMVVGDRLRGNPYLLTGSTAAENTDADSLMTPTASYGNAFSAMNGVGVGNDATSKVNIDTTSNNHVAWAFKRASKFFDVVCYTGTGSATTQTHNLGVAPELMIVKRRDTTSQWTVYNSSIGATNYLALNETNASAASSTRWNNTSPTASVFSLGTFSGVNASGGTYVAYLFATLAGISKVGTYTGNGSNQTIDCGFTAGAKFVLVKATSTTGDWVVLDTARGIVSGNDPFLQLNSTAAEVTNEDIVDPANSGFVVNETTEAINTNGVTYLFYAVA